MRPLSNAVIIDELVKGRSKAACKVFLQFYRVDLLYLLELKISVPSPKLAWLSRTLQYKVDQGCINEIALCVRNPKSLSGD